MERTASFFVVPRAPLLPATATKKDAVRSINIIIINMRFSIPQKSDTKIVMIPQKSDTKIVMTVVVTNIPFLKIYG